MEGRTQGPSLRQPGATAVLTLSLPERLHLSGPGEARPAPWGTSWLLAQAPPLLGCHMADTLPLLRAGARWWWFSLLLFYLLSQCSLQREHSHILEPPLWLAPKGLRGRGLKTSLGHRRWPLGNDLSAQSNTSSNSNQRNNTILNMGISYWVMCLARS